MKLTALIALTFVPAAALAQDVPDILCIGRAPDWRLEVSDGQGRFTFPAPTVMEIPNVTQAEGQSWPLAITLIGDRDTGIVILHKRACGSAPFEAQMLTQRGQTPILLTGCCETLE